MINLIPLINILKKQHYKKNGEEQRFDGSSEGDLRLERGLSCFCSTGV